jgi:hypothetical protein
VALENGLRTALVSSLLSATSCVTAAAPATPPGIRSPEALVDAQLDAYNRRDLEGFLAPYSDDVVLAKYPGTVTQTGKAEMRTRYQRSFANPNIRAEVLRRIILGNIVIDHERITAPPAKGEIEAVAVYEVAGGKIIRVTFLDNAPAAP